ncbi:hypothetical protein RhiirB3_413447 [Rhizophagus irregularis]|uniref:MATA-HMG n=1 Tax=Rhizophagus irregularis TaxID=588596 RepID=A0A1B1EVM0_9GLOM|nr:MATA-HMG [Rhizophagus irregularis]PKY24864.1 hypothetical protein RhiirB3_413447 [Rhizophagus irregularis]
MPQQASFQTLVRERPKVSISSPRMLMLNPNHFLPRRSGRSKTSNAFMIYRKVYNKVLMINGLPSKMTEVSRWASEAWKFEKEELKNEYRDFAKRVKEVYRERSQILEGPRTILPIRPDIQNLSVPIREQPNNFIVEESVQLLPEFFLQYPYNLEPICPSIRHDICDIFLPQIQNPQFDDIKINNFLMQEFHWTPTPIYEDEDLNMNFFHDDFY